ncbi:hypothetical protein PPTG_20655 [Phytophthora nicotianae INRA-310]|uniref:Uncharacterized protein n=1 Tax=Phytophthora nicotianae (strain INRA-310) TaxID=761204 RepID=W2RDM0_PHYN3|nr:hypothetical protein PPTG_20655 [Phytophthora nicotianae INRA-310]ETN23528.1 hypothetical protein PPTG_20655 [Phytophthora nicotianae INRA-310]
MILVGSPHIPAQPAARRDQAAEHFDEMGNLVLLKGKARLVALDYRCRSPSSKKVQFWVCNAGLLVRADDCYAVRLSARIGRTLAGRLGLPFERHLVDFCNSPLYLPTKCLNISKDSTATLSVETSPFVNLLLTMLFAASSLDASTGEAGVHVTQRLESHQRLRE